MGCKRITKLHDEWKPACKRCGVRRSARQAEQYLRCAKVDSDHENTILLVNDQEVVTGFFFLAGRLRPDGNGY